MLSIGHKNDEILTKNLKLRNPRKHYWGINYRVASELPKNQFITNVHCPSDLFFLQRRFTRRTRSKTPRTAEFNKLSLELI